MRAEAHVTVAAEAERRRVARRAVGLGVGVGVDGADVDEQRGEAADRGDETLVGGLLLHLRALRRAKAHEVVGAVVVDVRQGPKVGSVVREGALPAFFRGRPENVRLKSGIRGPRALEMGPGRPGSGESTYRRPPESSVSTAATPAVVKRNLVILGRAAFL